jgi:hypothetical protein
MPLDGMTLLKDPTSASWTGGVSASFETDGVTVAGGIHVADMTVADFRLRPHLTYKNRNPAQQKDGSFSKGKRDITLIIPIPLADGSISPQVFRGSFELHPELGAAGLSNLRHLAAQSILDADVNSFFTYGSTK